MYTANLGPNHVEVYTVLQLEGWSYPTKVYGHGLRIRPGDRVRFVKPGKVSRVED